MTDEEGIVQEFFQSGLEALQNRQLDVAVEHLNWAIRTNQKAVAEHRQPAECDLYRALAAAKPTADEDVIRHIYQALPTFGKLLGNLSWHKNSLSTMFLPGYLGLEYVLRTESDAHTAYASVLLAHGDFDEALRVLRSDRSAPRPPISILVEALTYFRAGRYGDVIRSAQNVLSANKVDPETEQALFEDGQPVPDEMLRGCAYVLTGASHAHLGEFEVASERFKSNYAARYINLDAERCYYLGMIEREKGNEPDALYWFNCGRAQKSTDELLEAISNPAKKIRITTETLIDGRSDPWNQDTEENLHEVKAVERAEAQESLLAEADSELQTQIGMPQVKAQVQRLRHTVELNQEKQRRGLKTPAKSMHLVFTGPPGTGKTTIANVVAKYYAGLGVCSNSTVVETTRNDLVGRHEGASADKTREMVNKADGGVLFVDEAYGLVQERNDGGTDPFGMEALTELLAQMDKRRDRLIVIFAGYEADINRLMTVNDGLRGRFPTWIGFQTYTPAEIVEIAIMQAGLRDVTLSDGAQNLIAEETAALYSNFNSEGKRLLDIAGNGRYVRSAIEKAEEFQSERLAGVNLRGLSNEALTELTAEDLRPALRALIDPILGRRPDEEGPSMNLVGV